MTRPPLASFASAIALGFVSLVLVPTAATAALYVPTKTADGADGTCDADCSLREAVQAANAHPGEDVILVHAGTYTLTLAGDEDAAASGDLDLLEDVTIAGDGAERTVVDGGAVDRILQVADGVDLEVSDLTLRNGRAPGAGGAVLNAGTLSLQRCVLSDNQSAAGNAGAGDGGAIASGATTSALSISASTLAGNQAQRNGGALLAGGTVDLRNVTVSGNDAGGNGGGVHLMSSAHATVRNLTVAGNRAGTAGGGLFAELTAFIGTAPALSNTIVATNISPTGPDCAGDVDTSYSLFGNAAGCNGPSAANHDLLGVDPKLDPLQNAGGPTPVRPLHQGPVIGNSPALDAGDPAAPGSTARSCEPTDQRGAHRSAGGRCDIGAYELTTECIPGGVHLCLVGNRFLVTAAWERNDGSSGAATAVQQTRDSGYFWFFGPDNVEVTVKAIDACSFNDRFWVYAAGTTDVKVTLNVVDTQTRQGKTYTNPLGHPFSPILDSNAFDTCP
jgi:CSLREA domain-containing protein